MRGIITESEMGEVGNWEVGNRKPTAILPPFSIPHFPHLLLESERKQTHAHLQTSHGPSGYKAAFAAAMDVFRISKAFPKEETYSLTDQIRRSSRSVCANLAEAWRKRRSAAFFISTLNISEAEAAETPVWLQFAVECGYISADDSRPLYKAYDEILAQLVHLITHPEPYVLK